MRASHRGSKLALVNEQPPSFSTSYSSSSSTPPPNSPSIPSHSRAHSAFLFFLSSSLHPYYTYQIAAMASFHLFIAHTTPPNTHTHTHPTSISQSCSSGSSPNQGERLSHSVHPPPPPPLTIATVTALMKRTLCHPWILIGALHALQLWSSKCKGI